MKKQITNHPDYFVNENGIVTDIRDNYIRASTNYNGELYVRLDGMNIKNQRISCM